MAWAPPDANEASSSTRTGTRSSLAPVIENSQRFSGKRVIVTGAAGGVGSRLVEMFRAEGATVVGTDVVAGDGIVATDLRDEQAIESFAAAAVEDLGGLDVLCNVAGIQRFGRLGDITASELRLHT